MHGVSPGHAAHEPLLRLWVYPGADPDSSRLIELLIANRDGQSSQGALSSFATPERTFIIDQVPTAPSGNRADLQSADLSVILIDAATGVTPEARHHIATA